MKKLTKEEINQAIDKGEVLVQNDYTNKVVKFKNLYTAIVWWINTKKGRGRSGEGWYIATEDIHMDDEKEQQEALEFVEFIELSQIDNI